MILQNANKKTVNSDVFMTGLKKLCYKIKDDTKNHVIVLDNAVFHKKTLVFKVFYRALLYNWAM